MIIAHAYAWGDASYRPNRRNVLSLFIVIIMSVPVGETPPEDKVVLVGNPGVGKSTIFQFFRTGKFVHADQLSHHDKAEHTKEWIVSGSKRSVSI